MLTNDIKKAGRARFYIRYRVAPGTGLAQIQRHKNLVAAAQNQQRHGFV